MASQIIQFAGLSDRERKTASPLRKLIAGDRLELMFVMKAARNSAQSLGIKPVTSYRYVDPNGNLRDYGKRVLRA
ncbi:hypothetical protein ACCS93_38540 [Rhizobium ruizarguesonis]